MSAFKFCLTTSANPSSGITSVMVMAVASGSSSFHRSVRRSLASPEVALTARKVEYW